MKRILLGAVVGGILLLLWQSLSWTILELHANATAYTPKQDSILSYLGSHLEKEGSYFLPNLPKGASAEEHEALMKSSDGKPWAQVVYHESMDTNMVMNIIRGLLVNIVIVALLGWLFSKMQVTNFSSIFMSSIAVGLIVFLNGYYTMHIWFESFDLTWQFIDYLISWGLVGVWMGWLFGKNNKK